MDFLVVAIYAILGIILMILGNYLIDLVIPCDFPDEIKKGNKAVGHISSGGFIAVGILVRQAIIGAPTTTVETSLLNGMISTVLYFLIGIVFCILGYYIFSLFNKKYELNKEIENGNTAAGIMVSGMFIGIGILISGVIA